MRPTTIEPGARYGRLTVVEFAYWHEMSGRRWAKWECRCDCGTTTVILGQDLTNGHTRSCGCLRAEMAAEQILENR